MTEKGKTIYTSIAICILLLIMTTTACSKDSNDIVDNDIFSSAIIERVTKEYPPVVKVLEKEKSIPTKIKNEINSPYTLPEIQNINSTVEIKEISPFEHKNIKIMHHSLTVPL